MPTVPKKFGFLRTTLALWGASLFAGRAGVVTDSTPGPVERWGWYDGSAWKFSARSGASETFSAITVTGPFFAVKGAANPGHTTSRGIFQGSAYSALGFASANAAIYGYINCYFNGSTFAAATDTDGVTNPTAFLNLGSTDGSVSFLSYLSALAANEAFTLVQRWGYTRYGQGLQWGTELTQSGRYVKTTDTTIGPTAAAKASMLNGGVAAGGFAAVTDPAHRWNAVGVKNRTELAGVVTTVANQILTFELYRNGVAVTTLTTPARSYGTGTPWRLVIKQTVRAAGSGGTVRVLMRFYCTADNANSAASCYATEVTLTGVDLTTSHTWDVVCTIPNNAGNQITCQDAEKVG